MSPTKKPERPPLARLVFVLGEKEISGFDKDAKAKPMRKMPRTSFRRSEGI
jgi:hypothetical protein